MGWGGVSRLVFCIVSYRVNTKISCFISCMFLGCTFLVSLCSSTYRYFDAYGRSSFIARAFRTWVSSRVRWLDLGPGSGGLLQLVLVY